MVRDEPDGARPHAAHPDTARGAACDEAGRVVHLQEDHVRLGARRVERDALRSSEGLGEVLGARVVGREAGRHARERDDARRGEDAGLAHAAAKELAVAVRLL